MDKKLILIGGLGCTGKTTFAEKLDRDFIAGDFIYNLVQTKLGIKQELMKYAQMAKTWDDPSKVGIEDWGVFKTMEECVKASYLEYLNYKLPSRCVIEGTGLFWNPKELKIVQEIFEGYEIRYIWLVPDYEQWVKNRSKRLRRPGFTTPFYQEQEYERLTNVYRGFMPKEAMIIRDTSMVGPTPTGGIGYQREEFSNPKWEKFAFPKDMGGKTFLDISCNTGWFLECAEKQGAKVYGVDIAYKLLEVAMDKTGGTFFLSKIEDFVTDLKFDYILCSSAFHYYKKREQQIEKISKMTDYFVLELPVLDTEELDLRYQGGEDNEFCALPSKGLIEKWLKKYFTKVELIDYTYTPAGSSRPVYRCTK